MFGDHDHVKIIICLKNHHFMYIWQRMLNGLSCYAKRSGTAVYQRFLGSKPTKEKTKNCQLKSNSNTFGLKIFNTAEYSWGSSGVDVL